MINVERIKKVSVVGLKRLSDDAVFVISAPCVLRLPDGLVHVTGALQEELDPEIWDVSQKFKVISCLQYQEHL
jgi:hypothetical protein